MVVRRFLLKEINRFRRENGKGNLHFHEAESKNAQRHSEHCARIGKNRHTDWPLGHNFNTELVSEINPDHKPEERARITINGFKSSTEGHREALLDAREHVAIGEKNGHTTVRLKT